MTAPHPHCQPDSKTVTVCDPSDCATSPGATMPAKHFKPQPRCDAQTTGETNMSDTRSSLGSAMAPPNDLADRIEAYLSDHPGNGGHSDAAGGSAWELLDEAMHELRSPDVAATPSSLQGMIAAIYGELDAEDCNWIDREWINWRGRGTITHALSGDVAQARQVSEGDVIIVAASLRGMGALKENYGQIQYERVRRALEASSLSSTDSQAGTDPVSRPERGGGK